MTISVLPVIHVRDADQAVAQATVAFGAGADGVFLIDHGGGPSAGLLEVFNAVDGAHPGRFVGVNFLGLPSALEGFRVIVGALERKMITRAPDGLWTDDAIPDAEAGRRFQLEHLDGQIRHFGGVAFKYTRTYTDDPQTAAAEASRWAPLVDVVTTSGPGTGQSAEPAKVAAMKAAVHGQSVALASGVDAENISAYAGSADIVLAASSVETSSYSGIFEPRRLADLITAAHRL